MIRDATEADAAACAAIYAPYVRETTVSFELEPPTLAEMAERIAAAQARHAWLVLEDDERVVGYAYANRFSARPAYQWSLEVSIYLEQGRHRAGGGRAAVRGAAAAAGRAGLPPGDGRDEPAQRGQRRVPPCARVYAPVGVYRQVGWKHGYGRTWPGCSGRSPTGMTRRPSRAAQRSAADLTRALI